MTCDALRNRFLALPDLSRPTDDLRTHLTTCPACSAWLAKAHRLDRRVAALPAPDSAEARAAFVDYLDSAGPVIRTVPRIARPAGISFDWRLVAGLAAALLVGVGFYAFTGGGKTQPEVAGARHELLAQSVDYVAAMSRTRSTPERTKLSIAMAGNLRTEVKDLYKNAPPDDLSKLADLYEKVVARGLIPQAKDLEKIGISARTRQDLWGEVRDHLKGVVDDTTVMRAEAPETAKASLDRMRKAAREGQAQVQKLIDGV